MTEIAVYVEGKLYPQVKDILGELMAYYPDVTGVEMWSEATTDRTMPVLILGVMPSVTPITFVKTLSQKQILTNPAALTELRAAMDRLQAPFVFPEMTFVMDDVSTLQGMGKRVVVDIETGGDIDIMLPEEMWLLSVAITDGKKIVVLSEEWLARDINRTMLINFLRSGRKLIAHNMKFDFRSLSAQLGVDIKGHLCTMLLHHALNPGAKEHDLKKTAAKYVGAPNWADAGKEYVKGTYKVFPDWYPELLKKRYAGKKVKVGFEAIPKDILYKYNAYDVFYTWYLYEYLARGAEGDPRIARIAKFEFEMSNFFQDVERNGVAVDLEYLEGLRVILVQQEVEALSRLRELVFVGTQDVEFSGQFNPNSHVQVKKFFAAVGSPVKSTSETVLEDMKFEEGTIEAEFTAQLLECRGITKLKGTYVEGIQKRLHNGLVYPDFLVHGTSTGRLSSRDPNIQNVPRDEDGKISLREIFIPRDIETRSLLMVDYSQAELRVMACLSDDEYLISLFQPGMPDFFDSLMPIAFPRVDLSTLDKDTKKNMRANLKGVIYGMSYGRRAPAIAKALGMSSREAQTIMNNYFKAAPDLYAWRMWISETAISPEHTLISPFGRYYQSEVVTSRNKQNVINSGLAFLPQSTASDICVVAAMEVNKWLHEYDAVIIATIHDAIMIDCPDEHLQVVSDRVQLAMQESGRAVFGDKVPFATDATHGKSWRGI